jgi:hypothetical protein
VNNTSGCGGGFFGLSTERRITWKYLSERKGNGKEEKFVVLACVFDSLHNF